MTTALVPLTDMERMAEAIARSGLFGMKTADQALALMLTAQAEGQHPATITQDYDIIQGRAARKTHSVLARFQSAGGTVQWHALTDDIADATFTHPSGGSVRIDWTMARAQQAKLTGKDNWRNYPRAMLRARCIAEGVRTVWPAAIGGYLVSEEAQDITPPADRQERDITPTKTEAIVAEVRAVKLDQVLNAIREAATPDDMAAAKDLATKLADAAEKQVAQGAYKKRLAELKKASALVDLEVKVRACKTLSEAEEVLAGATLTDAERARLEEIAAEVVTQGE